MIDGIAGGREQARPCKQEMRRAKSWPPVTCSSAFHSGTICLPSLKDRQALIQEDCHPRQCVPGLRQAMLDGSKQQAVCRGLYVAAFQLDIEHQCLAVINGPKVIREPMERLQ